LNLILSFAVTLVSLADQRETPGIVWRNAPDEPARAAQARPRFEAALKAPAIGRVIPVSGAAEFEFKLKGGYFIEFFLEARDEYKHSFSLAADGRMVDDRNRLRTQEARMRPRSPSIRTLYGFIDGPARLTIRSNADEYGVSAVRWMPRAEFEREALPAVVERARWLQSHIEPGAGTGDRPEYLRQLYERMMLSPDPAVKREALLGLTRAYYWLAAENDEPHDHARLAELLQQCLRQMYDEPLLRQTISAACSGLNSSGGRPLARGRICEQAKPVFWKSDVPDAPLAPRWAVAQLRLKRRMEAITRWWVEERQLPNGELGGGWGDDVEILRNWGVLALGLGSEVAAKGVERVADGVWASGQIEKGYYHRISDVEHSSEPSTDTQPLLAALRPDDPGVIGRLRETAGCAKYWIGKQPDGHYRFHTSWFNCRERDKSPERAVDVHLNLRAMGPALWYAYLTKDPETVSRLWHWGESWIAAMRATAHGKPAGMIPPAVRASDGGYLIHSAQWDKPGVEWDYFQWSGRSQAAITSLFLALVDLTGEGKWLEAATESFAAADSNFVISPEAFFEWRWRVKDPRWDQLFGWKPQAQDAELIETLREESAALEERISSNFDMMTREAQFTDRVYYQLPAAARRLLFGGEAPRGERYPFFAVTWIPAKNEYGRAVLGAALESLRLRLYSFEPAPAKAAFRVWRLVPGKYAWRGIETKQRGEFVVSKLPQIVELPLEPGREVTIEIKRRK
jgi:hypothetical protein